MSNKIEIKENKVIKTFSNRMDFVRESSIYEKIAGKGLAPEYMGGWDGTIEHEYIQGESFDSVILKAMSNPYHFVECANLFFDWYKRFREALNLSLGDMDFSDFVFSDGKLYCIDFEHCRPGNAEDDVSKLAAEICLAESTYTLFGMEDTKIFVKAAWERIDMNSSKLYNAMNEALDRKCKTKNINPLYAANEYLATFVCCAFVRAPKTVLLSSILKALRKSNQEWTLFTKNITGENEKFVRLIMSAAKEDYNAIYLTEGGSIAEFPLLLRTSSAIDVLQMEQNSKLSLKDILMLKFNSKGMAVESMK